MANNRLSMRKITEVLRLYFEHGRSKREIARIIGASPSTFTDYLSRAKLAGLSYPLPPELDDAALARRLFPPSEPSAVQRPPADWAAVHAGLRRKGVTLDLLWQEYKAEQIDGFQYSAFCEHYRRWRQHLSLSMRQTHTPGERLFIDYAGPTVDIIELHSGEIRQAQIFVAVLGASNYTYIEATWSQQLPDWIGSHVRALDFFGGVTELWVPDNLRSGVSKASRYEPDINPTYQDLATHYDVAVLPARARKPKDKAKVENGVLVVERWVLARLRHQRFFSLNELNRMLRTLLSDLNQRPFEKLPGSRASAFAEMDQPALRALPLKAYEYAEWKLARVGVDYHVEADAHYYSVPCQHARQEVNVRITAATVEIFLSGTRLSSHLRSTFKGRHSRTPMRAASRRRDTNLPIPCSPSLRAFDNADNLSYLEQRFALLLWSRLAGTRHNPGVGIIGVKTRSGPGLPAGRIGCLRALYELASARRRS